MLQPEQPAIAAPENLRWVEAKRKFLPYAYLSPTLALLAALTIIPIATVFLYSLVDNVIVNPNPPVFVGLDNYETVLGDRKFRGALGNTLYFAVVSVAAHFVIGLSFALLLNTRLLGSKTKALFRVIYILPWVFTASIIAILWRLLLNPHGVVNFVLLELGFVQEKMEWLADRDLALNTVTFINIWAGYPFYMVSFLAGLQGIPDDLYEAGRVDGGNSWQLFRFITLPQLKPIIVSLALLDFIWTIHQFTLIWMTTGGGPMRSTEVLSTYTYKAAFSSHEYSIASTLAMIILAICTFVGILYVRNQRMTDA
ncbi:MAG: sugar ABC transporter permease [Chloroflexi bacterium]|nr:sugar ABC transporter permease [Chloroflexota bacterium]MCY4246922.1 sugar ABC transporter permease [Chloroflexota bacterium]